ncbi:hypothetical protein K8R61_02395, partial [bacterium]|nr:hypothetical protein [bacterium]
MKKYITFILLIFLISCSSQKCDEIEINMNGDFVSYEIKTPVKAGITIFEIPEDAVFYIDTPIYSDYVKPWGNVVYITITTPNGKEKKLSSKICRTDYISNDGYIIVRTKSNPKYFISETDNIWTGIGNDLASFQECPIILKIRNVKNCKKNIPLLKNLPTEEKEGVKTDGNSSLYVPSIFKPGLEVLKKAM